MNMMEALQKQEEEMKKEKLELFLLRKIHKKVVEIRTPIQAAGMTPLEIGEKYRQAGWQLTELLETYAKEFPSSNVTGT